MDKLSKEGTYFQQKSSELVDSALDTFPDLKHIFTNATEITEACDKLLPNPYLEAFTVPTRYTHIYVQMHLYTNTHVHTPTFPQKKKGDLDFFSIFLEVMSARFGWSPEEGATCSPGKLTPKDVEACFPNQLQGFASCMEKESALVKGVDFFVLADHIRTTAMAVVLRMGIPWDMPWAAELNPNFVAELSTGYSAGHRCIFRAGNKDGSTDLAQIDRFLARLSEDPLRVCARGRDAMFTRNAIAAKLITHLAKSVKVKLLTYAKSMTDATRKRHMSELIAMAQEYAVAIGCIRVATLLHFSVSGLLQVNPKGDTFYGPGLNALFRLKTYEEVDQVVPTEQVRFLVRTPTTDCRPLIRTFLIPLEERA